MIVADLVPLATPLDDVALLEGNPRVGDVDAIARSLVAFGQRKPVVANRATGEVIAGNHTVRAARQLGWDEVAVVWVDDDPTTAHAFALADNRTAELGGYDDAALAALIAEVHDADEELLAATGWSGDDLQELLDRLTEPEPVAVAPRSYPDATGAAVVRADALAMPLATASVDLLISSPPYFALRSYQDEGEHYAGQLGSEPTPAEFLAALWAVMDEGWRVLKPGASAWINLGDKYGGSGCGPETGALAASRHGMAIANMNTAAKDSGVLSSGNRGYDVPDKSLMGLPWRFALGLCCPDQYRPGGGPQWTLRAEVIWDKPNCLSGGTNVYAKVKGRPTVTKLHDLCRHYAPDQVQLWNGRRWTQVLWWQPTERTADTNALELELRNGERIGCTPDHRWPVVGKGNVHARDLTVGDVLEPCRLPDSVDGAERLDDEIGWFVGAYLANGSRSGGTIQVASHVKHEARLKRLQVLAESFGESCHVYRTSGNGVTINLCGRFLDAALATYVGGQNVYTKCLRPGIWSRDDRFLRAVLEGYVAGDAHTEASGRITLNFTGRNDDLARDLRALAARLGMSLRLRRGTVDAFGRTWPTWAGTLYEDVDRRKKSDTEVVAVRRSRARRFWDIGVADEPHLFALASGVLTHNSLPESVTDRVRRSHENWFHFTKGERYFAGLDEVREEQTANASGGPAKARDNGWGGFTADAGRFHNPLGKLPGSVWSIPSQPLTVPDDLGVDHFAAFPPEWPRRIIDGWSPTGICTACGEPRAPVVEKSYRTIHHQRTDNRTASVRTGGATLDADKRPYGVASLEATITGYRCGCEVPEAPTRPAVVLDPFGGTGTVAMMARAMGRYGVHLDLSRDYNRLARWRIFESDGGQRCLDKAED